MLRVTESENVAFPKLRKNSEDTTRMHSKGNAYVRHSAGDTGQNGHAGDHNDRTCQ